MILNVYLFKIKYFNFKIKIIIQFIYGLIVNDILPSLSYVIL